MKCLSLFGVELNPPGVGELGLLGLRSDVLLINRGQGLKQRDRHRGAVTLLETAVSHQKLGQQQNRANGELIGPKLGGGAVVQPDKRWRKACMN